MEPIKYHKLKYLVDELNLDIEKFYKKGNNTAGLRVRKTLQEVKSIAQEIRLEVTKIKKER